uniref:Uncharacterized protein n=1 Tax=Arundo donax TaxID=35708 RepID=A0A0A8XXM5_ARUDO
MGGVKSTSFLLSGSTSKQKLQHTIIMGLSLMKATARNLIGRPSQRCNLRRSSSGRAKLSVKPSMQQALFQEAHLCVDR